MISNYRMFLLSNSLFATSIYTYNSPNAFVNMLYIPGLFFTFLMYRLTGAHINN